MMDLNKKILVTSPLLPSLEEFNLYLKDIWDRKWLTNNGYYHQQLEDELAKYLNVPYLSLFTNGTLPLMVALKALDIKGEVITTPYSFVATAHSLCWSNITPIFVDVDPKTGNIDPEKIEQAITSNTTAIMPVHVYGNPCDVDVIQEIADKHNLKVIYDAAHAFGVEENGQSVLQYGDISTLSFHATKTYNTIEGGALICHTKEMKQRIDQLKNFGFVDEISVDELGINGKLDEVRAAYGLLQLKHIDKAIEKRKELTEIYIENLKNIDGIDLLDIKADKLNYSYFPILVDESKYHLSRDALYNKLKENNIFARRYFYPLISEYQFYQQLNLPSADKNNLPNAYKLSQQVICLPMHHELSGEEILKICNVIEGE
ncbi:UDP-4-amino-4-deoxy-L-arabinose--oxoglutarate aminotransferase [Phocoenobacter uteri]|uniref:UDP-4-amino-4-deoxy-L-arabinose--oxoglutarate aminotransferase n=1 Tax=Phocoenobacter uteri TaxID=146806 RepID=A0A379CA01_9PAST|nr:DegT/DnrJ/EryC1/StrS family aminotransferase [Phocoenobacter uteri]MDG6881128.1 aminotransferase [Phocoenobacter uteri]SUB59150.1 UDP-4-amino-4-deoxy-L-arabinose--oxoglutarate aminotransferase [Phocoenobacter uteri]